jgi:hypothetical protein
MDSFSRSAGDDRSVEVVESVSLMRWEQRRSLGRRWNARYLDWVGFAFAP